MEPPKAIVSETPEKKLYDAATTGDVATFQTLVQQDPFLVDQVSFSRSRNLLHIATMAGQLGIVEELLRRNTELARDVDDQGMNPVHIAAMRGHVGVLQVLLKHDLSPAGERLHRGQTVLHLCAKHGQVQTLKFLAETMSDLLDAKDDDGETLLHLAVRCNQVEMVKYLLENDKVENLTENSMGKTPLDILGTTMPSEIEKLLLFAYDPIASISREITDMTMVVVGLIAAMAFSAAVNPPGGVWQDDTSSHRAGKAVMASSHPNLYSCFSFANTAAFISSLIAMRAPTHAQVLLGFIWCATLLSLASIGMSYGASLIMTNPIETVTFDQIVAILVAGLVGILVLVHICIATTRSYRMWKREKRQRTISDRIFRGYYEWQRSIEDSVTESRGNLFKAVIIQFKKVVGVSE